MTSVWLTLAAILFALAVATIGECVRLRILNPMFRFSDLFTSTDRRGRETKPANSGAATPGHESHWQQAVSALEKAMSELTSQEKYEEATQLKPMLSWCRGKASEEEDQRERDQWFDTNLPEDVGVERDKEG